MRLASTKIFISLFACAFYAGHSAWARNDFSIGVEGFRDQYSESIGVDNHAEFGSVDLGYTHTSEQLYISRAELRGSYGKNNYKSSSGVLNDVLEYETELRLTTGVTIPLADGNSVIPYTGGGVRYFYDNNKGRATNLGALGYDRRILQFYVPVGADAHFNYGGWTLSPSLEADWMAWGRVDSRLQNVGFGLPDVENTQHDGYGLRGAFLVGQQYTHFGWEFGPFVRYWHVNDSKPNINQQLQLVFIEPRNDRLQAGLELIIHF